MDPMDLNTIAPPTTAPTQHVNIVYLVKQGTKQSKWISCSIGWEGEITTYKDLCDKVLLPRGVDSVLQNAWREVDDLVNGEIQKEAALCAEKPVGKKSSLANLNDFGHWRHVYSESTELLPEDLSDLLKRGTSPDSAPTLYLCIVCPNHNAPKLPGAARIWKPNSPGGCKTCKDAAREAATSKLVQASAFNHSSCAPKTLRALR